jgi:acyl-CoA thioester hydrolase
MSFSALSQAGINLVVTRAEIHYKSSLKSGDIFSIGLNHLALSKIRGQFIQTLLKQGSEKPMVIGCFDYVAINNVNKPLKLDEIFKTLG